MLNWPRRILIVAINVVAGTLIGPVNLLLTLIVVGLLRLMTFSEIMRLPAALTKLLPGFLLSKESLILTFPCLISTLILAPFLIRYFEMRGRLDKIEQAQAGIMFGMKATLLTLFILGVSWDYLPTMDKSGVELPPLVLGIAVAFLGYLPIVAICGPAIAVSGALFGIFNYHLVNKLRVRTE